MNSKTTDDILQVLRSESAAILSREQREIDADAQLSVLGFDSLRFVELLVAIEVNFEVKLIDANIQSEDIQTLRTLAHCISRVS